MKVLYITTLHRPGNWLAEAFAADGATKILLEEVVGVTAGLARLRDEVFDAVVVSHEPGVLDGLDLVEGFRAGGHDEPLLLVGEQTPQQLEARASKSEPTTTAASPRPPSAACSGNSPARSSGTNSSERKSPAPASRWRQRLHQEHREAQHLLEQQRLVIADLEILKSLTRGSPAARVCRVRRLPRQNGESLLGTCRWICRAAVAHYRELLRTYVIMGVGNLTTEMADLSEMLATSGVSAQRALQLHVTVLEELVAGLGARMPGT